MKVSLDALLLLALVVGLEARDGITRFDLHALRGATNQQEALREALKHDGAFAVQGLSDEYVEAVKALNQAAPDCLNNHGMAEITLSDGSLRRTYATNIDKAYPDCIVGPGSVISDEFDRAFSVVAQALERRVTAGAAALQWKPNQDSPALDFKDLGKKEHIHVYAKTLANQTGSAQSLDFHVDSGILLML